MRKSKKELHQEMVKILPEERQQMIKLIRESELSYRRIQIPKVIPKITNEDNPYIPEKWLY